MAVRSQDHCTISPDPEDWRAIGVFTLTLSKHNVDMAIRISWQELNGSVKVTISVSSIQVRTSVMLRFHYSYISYRCNIFLVPVHYDDSFLLQLSQTHSCTISLLLIPPQIKPKTPLFAQHHLRTQLHSLNAQQLPLSPTITLPSSLQPWIPNLPTSALSTPPSLLSPRAAPIPKAGQTPFPHQAETRASDSTHITTAKTLPVERQADQRAALASTSLAVDSIYRTFLRLCSACRPPFSTGNDHTRARAKGRGHQTRDSERIASHRIARIDAMESGARHAGRARNGRSGARGGRTRPRARIGPEAKRRSRAVSSDEKMRGSKQIFLREQVVRGSGSETGVQVLPTFVG